MRAMTRKDIPAYFKWRGGRPRWEPGPTLRAKGFHGRDLKDDSGAWLSRGRAIDVADKLNEATRGEPASALPNASEEKTLGRLIELYQADNKFKKLGDRTKRDYRMHMRILSDWAADVAAAAISRPSMRNFHGMLVETRGAAMANAVFRTFKLLLYYAVDELEWMPRNRARKLAMAETHGRLVVYSIEEITCFVAFADALGMPSYGDALIAAATTGIRQADLLGAPDGAFSQSIYSFQPGKTQKSTKKLAHVPVMPHLRRRVEAAKLRRHNLAPLAKHELLDEAGQPFTDKKGFGEGFRLIRAYASGMGHALAAAGVMRLDPAIAELVPMPSLFEKNWQDLRDTGVTFLFSAGCSIAEIATITGHSLKTVQEILDKHYFVRDPSFAVAAGNKLEAYLDQAGVKW